MTRAVIELSGDIKSFIPLLSRKIEGYAYFPGSNQATFRRGGVMLTLDSKEVNIYKAENETEARKVLDWLKNILEDVED
jgi:ArsR family metal-binding transcriptional regulator